MKIKTFIVLFILIACGKKEPQSIVLPGNQASEAEAQIIERVVSEIQNEFDGLGVNVDLNSIPYHVTSLAPTIAGVCVYKENGDPVGIAINHIVLREWDIETTDRFGLIYRVLLHEIGHCFFQRQHEDDELLVPGYDDLDISVMKDYGDATILKVLWPYYVKEVVGLERADSVDDFRRYLNFTTP